jgi:MinD superfamily P-loop ATPase
MVLAVAEPTLSGLWGLERVAGVADRFEVPLEVCINKSDINEEIARRISDFAASRGKEVAGEIPFEEDVYASTTEGKILVEYSDGEASQAVRQLWERINDLLVSLP